MTDKEKILKAINQKQQEIWPTDTGEMAPATVPFAVEQGWLNALKWMEDFINSLPAEQPSKDLEKAATALTNEIVGELNVGDYTDHSGHNAHWHSFKDGVVAGANWQKNQTINKACEWLRRCVDVDDEVKMINGEPEAESFIQKNIHRIKVTNQIVEDFKKAMEDK